jgi:hypothetical protein
MRMLDIRAEIHGDKVLLDGLHGLSSQGIAAAQKRGLFRIARGTHRQAFKWLSGAGGASKKVRKDYVGFTKKSGEDVMFRSFKGAGAYPVPVRTGNLRDHLDWLAPGASKGDFSAAPDEAIVFDSAEYASDIHEGKGSSAKYGPREFIEDGFRDFNQGFFGEGDRSAAVLDEELEIEIKKRGLG